MVNNIWKRKVYTASARTSTQTSSGQLLADAYTSLSTITSRINQRQIWDLRWHLNVVYGRQASLEMSSVLELQTLLNVLQWRSRPIQIATWPSSLKRRDSACWQKVLRHASILLPILAILNNAFWYRPLSTFQFTETTFSNQSCLIRLWATNFAQTLKIVL